MWEAEIAVVLLPWLSRSAYQLVLAQQSVGFLHPRLHLAFSVILLAIEVSSTSVVRTSCAAQEDQQHSLCCSGPS